MFIQLLNAYRIGEFFFEATVKRCKKFLGNKESEVKNLGLFFEYEAVFYNLTYLGIGL